MPLFDVRLSQTHSTVLDTMGTPTAPPNRLTEDCNSLNYATLFLQLAGPLAWLTAEHNVSDLFNLVCPRLLSRQ